MNIKKKLLTLGALLLISATMLNAQMPPAPGDDPENQASQSLNREVEPVGTATALLLGLGAGVLGYRLRKNSDKE